MKILNPIVAEISDLICLLFRKKMKVGIIGGGVAGLSAAYYIKKLALPVSQIILIESSDRFGGWVNSEKYFDKENNRSVTFESGARILRYKPLQRRELNTLNLAKELNLMNEIDFVSETHPSTQNRYIYLYGKLSPMNPNIVFKNELLDKSLLYYLYKEFNATARPSDVKDESIYSFISRRFGSDFAEKIVDPYFKNICSGDIKELSALSLLKSLYLAEGKYGSITKGYIKGRAESRIRMHERFTNFSIWRFKNGMQTLTDALVDNLRSFDDVNLNKNEECKSIILSKNSNQVEIKTNKNSYNVDLVISSVYSKYLEKLLSNDHSKLKSLLNKIDAVNVIAVNLYFDKNVLPSGGFGYFVPSIENSPILTCYFDSVFDTSNKNYTTLTLMLGGPLYDRFFNKELENNPDKLANFALNSLRKHIKIDAEPKTYKVSVLKNCIPQYKVGHENLIKDINGYLVENKLNDKLKLIGASYDGFGIKDVIYNSKKLSESLIKKK